MRGKTDLHPHPSTKLACQLGKFWGEPAANGGLVDVLARLVDECCRNVPLTRPVAGRWIRRHSQVKYTPVDLNLFSTI